MRALLPLFAAGLLGLPAAAQQRAGKPQIVDVRASDAAMEAAKARARRELPAFYAHLARPTPDERDFMLKYDVIDGPRAEFIWATDVTRAAGGITGTLIDDAVDVGGFKAGQRVRIAEAAIIDWGYRKRGVMQGSYTTRVLLDRIDPAAAAHYRRDLGW